MDFGAITITDAGGGPRTSALNRATVRIGRAPDNDVVLDDAQVDLQHAEILSDPSGCMVFDLSSGKTLLNGAALAENPQLLANGDVLTIGTAQIAVQIGPQPTSDPLLQSLLAAPPSADQDLLAQLLAPSPPTRPRTPIGTPRRDPAKTQPLPVSLTSLPPAPLAALPPADPAPTVETAQSFLFLKLSPAELTLDTGATATLKAQIENQAEIVTSVSLTVLGIPPEWVKLPDSILPLYTNTRREIEFTITPLRAPTSLAGTYDVTVIVQSKDRATDQASVHLQLTVLPYTQFKAALEPKRLSRWFLATYTLTIANDGNQAQDFKLEGRDDEELMRFRFSPLSPVRVKPNEIRRVRTRVRLSASRMIGKPQTYPFNVTVSPSDAAIAPARLEAELVQSPPLPPWALAAILVALVVACLAFTFFKAIPYISRLINSSSVATAQTATAGAQTAIGAGEAPTPPLPGAATNAPTAPTGADATAAPTAPQSGELPTQPGSAAPTEAPPTAAPTEAPPTAAPTALPPTPTPTQEPGAPNIVLFDVSPQDVAPGAPVTVTWQVEGAERVVISVFGDVPPEGQRQYQPDQTTDFQLTATAPGGKQALRVVHIPVRALPPTATITPTVQITEQVITFNTLNGTPVTKRTQITGTEYEQQNVLISFFRLESAGLSLSKTADVASYSQEGQAIPYTLIAKNTGDATLSGVTISDPNLNTSDCQPKTLNAGQTLTCKGTHIITSADMEQDTLMNSAVASGTTSEGQTITSPAASATITRVLVPQLSLTLNATPTTYNVNDTITYSLNVINSGNVSLSNVSISDVVARNTYPPTSIATSTPVQTSEPLTLQCSPSIPVESLAPKAAISCTGSYKIPDDIVASVGQTITNTAIVSGAAPVLNNRPVSNGPKSFIISYEPQQIPFTNFPTSVTANVEPAFRTSLLLSRSRPVVAPAASRSCFASNDRFTAFLFQATQPPCIPQSVLDGLIRDGRVPVKYQPVIYPPGWDSHILDRYVVTADRSQGNFINDVIGAITFPHGVTGISITIWHPPDSRVSYRMYVLDETGNTIYIDDSLKNLTAAGEYKLTRSTTVDRPIRCVLIMGFPGDGSVQPADLQTDLGRAQAPLFIKEIRIPITP